MAAIGEGVGGFKVGDAVSVIPGFDMNDYGFYGDLANAPADLVAHHPSSLTWIEAAAIWMQYMTAYGALVDIAKLTRGDTVLIPAASSSVGIAAIQIANKVGATPIALTRTSAKRQALRDVGAVHVIATEEQDLVAEVKRITGGIGARVVFDPVGGPTVEKLTKAMAGFGTLFLYGALSTQPTPLPLFDVLVKDLTICGYKLMEVTNHPVRRERAKQFITAGLADGSLKPIIARTFPLDQIVEANRYLESSQRFATSRRASSSAKRPACRLRRFATGIQRLTVVVQRFDRFTPLHRRGQLGVRNSCFPVGLSFSKVRREASKSSSRRPRFPLIYCSLAKILLELFIEACIKE